MSNQTMTARLLLVGNGTEGTGPALSLSVMRVAEYSKEETPLLQVPFLWMCSCSKHPPVPLVFAGKKPVSIALRIQSRACHFCIVHSK